MAEDSRPFRHETARLILRDWREDDWDSFWEGTNTPEVMRWLGGVLDAEGKADQIARFHRYNRQYGHTFWAVERKSDGLLLGFCGLKRCEDKKGPFGMTEAGWRLRRDAWGQGYASEAARATLSLAFTRFNSDEVVAMTFEGNEPSWRLMLKLGMKRREEFDFVDTHWDVEDPEAIVYSISKREWEQL